MSEEEQAFIVAHRLLDEPNTDPDSDLCVLSRQLLRLREKCMNPHDVAKINEAIVDVERIAPRRFLLVKRDMADNE